MGDNHGFVTLGRDGGIQLKGKPQPILGGRGPIAVTPARIVLTGNGPSSTSSPYLKPLGVSWPASMGPSLSVQSDGDTSIIRQRPQISLGKRGSGDQANSDSSTTSCIPAAVGAVVATPFVDPFPKGSNIVLSAFGASGTPSLSYLWKINGVESGTGTSLPLTITDGIIVNKDASGLGQIVISVTINNACGTATVTGTFAAQGDPP